MMSNVAENLAKVQGIMSRWPRPAWVWSGAGGRREGEQRHKKESHERFQCTGLHRRHFYLCQHAPFILTTSLRMKDPYLHFAKRCQRVRPKAVSLPSIQEALGFSFLSPPMPQNKNKSKKSVCCVWWYHL